ncbi:MAG: YqjK-like family protein [Methylotenera sp.]|nr:YqjK-like family protein [Methylotenera sp.]
MKKKLALISKRREQLISQAAEQRLALAQEIEPLRSTLSLADRGLSIARYVKQRPSIAIGVAALFGILRPTRVGKWLQRGWGAFLLARNFRKLLFKNRISE